MSPYLVSLVMMNLKKLHLYDRIFKNTTVVRTLDFYYVFTTIDGINLPHFAPFRISVPE